MLQTVPHLSELLEAALPGSRLIQLTAMPKQLSTRRYYRLVLEVAAPGTPESCVVMQLPEDDPEGLARTQAEAFLDVQRFLASHGLRVPHVYGEALHDGLVLLEDLGDETFERRLAAQPRQAWDALYGSAIDTLAELHRLGASADPSASIALRRRYEPTLLRWELDHFREWGLEALQGPLSAADRAQLDAHFDALTAAIVALPSGLVHRDYQSRNLMWAPDGSLAILDFQDTFIGPYAYDLVALLCDSYVEIEVALQDAMLLRYARRRDYTAAELSELVRAFRLIAVQRKLKDAGRFIYVDRVRGNSSLLVYYPGSLRYVARALAQLPELSQLQHCLGRLVPGFPT